ncbi:NigD-like protein [Gaoshiqia sp. Z1-71]|uniref:NigD-like protein n=1 Tax=Gaoshiqia hydrogeniformans TaxID=3290090 RepID=UPI003BF875EF
MKQFLRFGLIGLIAISLFSCDLDDDDHYSLGKFWIGFGLIEPEDNDGTSFTIKMDNGSELFPVNWSHVHDWEDYDRVLVNYTILGDKLVNDEVKQYYVKVNSLKDILYKGILDITPAIEDSIGNDPIKVEDVWKTNHMLTFELVFYGNVKTHFINLVKEPGELTGDDQPIALELRHNDNGDDPRYRMTAFVTFDMSAIQIEGQDTAAYVITCKDYNNQTFTYEGVYRY